MRFRSVASCRGDGTRGGAVDVTRLGLRYRAWRDGANAAASAYQILVVQHMERPDSFAMDN